MQPHFLESLKLLVRLGLMPVTPGLSQPTTEAEGLLFDLVGLYDDAYEAAAATVSLSSAQACLLDRLDESRGMGALAAELYCDASNVTQIVARLEARGLVTREPDPSDGRARVITRTPEGDAVNARFEAAFAFAREALSRLSAREQQQLTVLLRKVIG
jgi:DNA-binding MarR family transcriptional regulator